MIFAEAIEEAVGQEQIEAIVVGFYGDYGWLVEDREDENDSDYAGPEPRIPRELRGKVKSWAEVRPYLAYEWDQGYGGAKCHPVYIWTPTRILWIHEYDGSTGLAWAPRNPTDIEPALSGSDPSGE